MKKILIVLFLLVGIASSVNYLPETALRANASLSMDANFPGNFEMFTGNINNATYVNSTYISITPIQFNAIIYYDGSNAIARYGNGTIISSGSDNATVIQASHDAIYATGGGKILVNDYFTNINTTINQNGTIAFIGEGDNTNILTGFEGTADPIINITRTDPRGKFIPLENLRIRTIGASNDGVASSTATDMSISKCQFRTDGSNGSMINVTWFSNSLIEDCVFYQEDEDQTGTAIKIWGSGSTYCAINSKIVHNSISHFDKAISITTDSKDYVAGMDISHNKVLGWNNYGVYINGSGSCNVADNMIDGNVLYGIYFDNCNLLHITDNDILMSGSGAQGVFGNLTNGGGSGIWIESNTVYNYDGGLLWAIVFTSKNTSNVASNTFVMGNEVSNYAGGIRYYHSDSGTYHLGQVISDNIIHDCSYCGLYLDGTNISTVTGNCMYNSGAVQYIRTQHTTVRGNTGIADS